MDLYILEEIDLHEISGVDDPAQPTAKATIIKRNNQEPTKPASVEKTNEEKMSEKVTDIEKALAKNEEALAEVTKSLEDANAKSAKAFAELDALMSMTQIEFETFKAMDADKKKELLELDEKERKKKLAKSAESEEIVKFEGKEIRKSAVGAESFAVYKRMIDMEAEVVKANEAATMVRLEKRASEEFAHLAGKPSEVAAVLKAMDAMPSDAKATLEAILKAAEVAAAEAFVTKGTEKAAAEAEVTKRSRDEKVSDIMKSRNVSKTRAMEIAAAEAPELFK